MPYVFSTLTNDTAYAEYEKGGGDLPVLKKKVLIKGGANVANNRLITSQGVMTKVSDEDLAFLKANKVFQMHFDKGFIKVTKLGGDPDKAARDMTGEDASAPRTPNHPDYLKGNAPQPIVGAPVSRDAA